MSERYVAFVKTLPMDYDSDQIEKAWLEYHGALDGLCSEELAKALRLGIDTSSMKPWRGYAKTPNGDSGRFTVDAKVQEFVHPWTVPINFATKFLDAYHGDASIMVSSWEDHKKQIDLTSDPKRYGLDKYGFKASEVGAMIVQCDALVEKAAELRASVERIEESSALGHVEPSLTGFSGGGDAIDSMKHNEPSVKDRFLYKPRRGRFVADEQPKAK